MSKKRKHNQRSKTIKHRHEISLSGSDLTKTNNEAAELMITPVTVNLFNAEELAEQPRDEIIKFLTNEQNKIISTKGNLKTEGDERLLSCFAAVTKIEDNALLGICSFLLGIIFAQQQGFSATEIWYYFDSFKNTESSLWAVNSFFIAFYHYVSSGVNDFDQRQFLEYSGFSEELDTSLLWLDKLLEEKNVPRKIFLSALQMKMVCQCLNKPEEAFQSAKEFYRNIRTPEGQNKVIEYLLSLMIEAPYSFNVSNNDLIIILPEAEYADNLLQEIDNSLGKPCIRLDTMQQMLESVIRDVTNNLNVNTEKVLQKIESSKEEISDKFHRETPATFRLKLINEYGTWIKEISNQGALINAEFLYDALGNTTWGEVINGYWDATENEIRNKFVKSLSVYLFKIQGNCSLSMVRGHSTTITNLLKVEEIQDILNEASRNSILNDFIAQCFPQHKNFICRELPAKFLRLRELRNPSAHGVVISDRNAAKETREIVLGTPDKPGILKNSLNSPRFLNCPQTFLTALHPPGTTTGTTPFNRSETTLKTAKPLDSTGSKKL